MGGGPAGASTAAWAARAGLDVLLVERSVFPRRKPCAEYLSPGAIGELDALGVLGEVEGAGAARLVGMRIVSDDGAAMEGRYRAGGGPHPARPYALGLPRERLDAIVLRTAARAGVEVRQHVALERLLVEDGVVVGARLRSGDRRWDERARAVVGADGLHSQVAASLRLARRRGPRRVALVARLAGVPGLREHGEMHVRAGRYLGIAPVGEGLVTAAVVVPAADAGAMAGDRAGFLVRELASVPSLWPSVSDARIVGEVLAAGPFARSTRRSIADGVLLVGDAADFFDPFTGEGVFAALCGGRLAARALAAALARGEATRRALRPYRAARRRAFLGKWVLERVAGLSATRPALMRRFTSRLGPRSPYGDLWIGAAGAGLPATALLRPRALAALLL